ncbi:PspC domain-containing protein [Roseateles amylovorans]|uniref:PspC domain-containing protein n=1 Tax=Roseateles amylovorans TaxID=2978473 RepID=A0ABY6AXG1_9BURK|nr:PspC domain-containing protein [Roseateles amylovorans]UXH77861.1 PspC domain-containing protein [Roseateles amylovorans]
MSDSEELQRLAELHQRGLLSDDEFMRAKARVLGGAQGAQGAGTSSASGGTTSGASTYAFHGAGAQAGSASAPRAPAVEAINRLRRARMDRWIGGVCGGIAQLTGITSWFWRIVFLLLVTCAGSGLMLYLLLWIFVPQED